MQKTSNYFMSRINLLFYYAFTNIITKITPHNSHKTFMSCGKDHLTPEAKVKEKMTMGQDNNYTIEMNSKLCLGAQ
jgi:hypothetical protein